MTNEKQLFPADNYMINKFSPSEIQRFKFFVTLSEYIISKRNELHLTQEELAAQSGVSRVTIARLERFCHTASIDVVFKLLATLDLELKIVDKKDENISA